MKLNGEIVQSLRKAEVSLTSVKLTHFAVNDEIIAAFSPQYNRATLNLAITHTPNFILFILQLPKLAINRVCCLPRRRLFGLSASSQVRIIAKVKLMQNETQYLP